MATSMRYVATLSGIDGVKRPCVFQCYVTPTSAKAWFAAADDAARDATGLGALFTAAAAMSEMSIAARTVTGENVEDTTVVPTEDVLRGNKLAFSLSGGGRKGTMTIPARNPASYTQAEDSLNCGLLAPAAMAAFVTAYQAVGVNIDGDDYDIVAARVVD